MPAKLAKIAKGAPAFQEWHVERRAVVDMVLEAFKKGAGPCLVGLVGDSGSGATTAASELVRSSEVQEEFSDGIVWLSVNDVANDRLAQLMLRLARKVHDGVDRDAADPPLASDDGAAYTKKLVERGRGGDGLKCLVVADDVCEKEVVSKLLETGLSAVLSTRDEDLVAGSGDQLVRVGELLEADAQSVLRKAADLPPDASLPDDADALIELCGRSATDLAFVGRWMSVRGQSERMAWSDVVGRIRKEMSNVADRPDPDRVKRRTAVLAAGFEGLSSASDDQRILQRLYMSLGILPDHHAFSVKDAAVVLFDGTPTVEDEASVGVLVDTLERLDIVRSDEGSYQMHAVHARFARERLMRHGDVRRSSLKRWLCFVSSLATLRSVGPYVLRGVWLAVERVGGDAWARARPYGKALDEMDELDPLLRETIQRLGRFQEAQGDLEGARTTWRRLLEAEKKELGGQHPHVIHSYGRLAECEQRLGNVGKAADWLRKEREGLPVALTKILGNLDIVGITRPAGEDRVPCLSPAEEISEPGDREEAEKLLRRCLMIKEAEVGPDHVELAPLLHRLGACLQQGGRLVESEELLRRCLAVKEAELGPDDGQVAVVLHQLGFCIGEAGRVDEAEALLRRCLIIKEANLGPENVQVALTLQLLGGCVGEAGRLDEAEELLRRCLAIMEAKLGPEDLELALTLQYLGECLSEAGRQDEAEVLLRRSLNIGEAKLGPVDVKVADTLLQLGACVGRSERLDEAEELLKRGLSIKEAEVGPEDLEVAWTLYELSVCAQKAERLDEAEELLRRCLLIQETKLGPEEGEITDTLRELGVCLEQAGRFEDAERLFRRCLAIKEVKKGPEDWEIADALHRLGVCVRNAGRLEEAEELLRRCLAIDEADLGLGDERASWSSEQPVDLSQVEGQPDGMKAPSRRSLGVKPGAGVMKIAGALYELSVCVQQAGRLDEAEEVWRRCLAITEAELGPNDGEVSAILHQLGVCLRFAGRLDEAEELFRRCLAIDEGNFGEERKPVANTLYQLAGCVREAGRLGEAQELWRRYLAIVEVELGPEHMNVADALHELGTCARDTGRLEEAEEVLKRCLAIKETELGLEDVRVAYTLHDLGMCIRFAQRPAEAEELLSRCLAIKEAELGPEDLQVAYTLREAGACATEAGRLSDAEQYLRRCVSIQEAKLGPDDIETAVTIHELGVSVKGAGRPKEAEELFTRCLATKEARLGPDSEQVAYTLLAIGMLAQEAGRLGGGDVEALSVYL